MLTVLMVIFRCSRSRDDAAHRSSKTVYARCSTGWAWVWGWLCCPFFFFQSPLTRAKAEAERALADCGMGFTILACNYFMEIWLSPALGFDYVQRKVVLFGDGRALITWVSYRDVAEFALRSHLTPGARNQILEVGGPQDLSPLEVVRIFEKVSGAPFERQFVPEEALLAQLETATDPLTETFAKLQLEYVHGCPMNTSAALRLMPMELTSVAQYASAVCGQEGASA